MSRRIEKRLLLIVQGLLLLCSCNPEPYCYEEIGLCPPPDIGVVAGELTLSKSVWFESEQTGSPGPVVCDEPLQTVCVIGQAGNIPEHVVMRGLDGLLILPPDPATPSVFAFIPARSPENVEFYDLNQDGRIEYLDLAYDENQFLYDDSLPQHVFRLWDYMGNLVWMRDGYGEPIIADVSGDGHAESLVLTLDGIQVISADGSVLDIPTRSGHSISMQIADIDGDGILEIVELHNTLARYPGSSVRNRVTTFGLDGSELASFLAEPGYISIVRRPGDTRDYFAVGSRLFDENGDFIVDAGTGNADGEECAFEQSDYSVMHVERTCWNSSDPIVRSKWFGQTFEIETQVRFDNERDAFRVRFEYSMLWDLPVLGGCGEIAATRTVLSIMDSKDVLVYQEVIPSASGRASFAVIPAENPNQEILLIGDSPRIWAYRLPQ